MNFDLTKNEKEWLSDFKRFLIDRGEGYVMSWWYARALKTRTSTVNYRLNKLVSKGALITLKCNTSYDIKYALAREVDGK